MPVNSKDGQIVGLIKRVEAGKPVASLRREACINSPTFYTWQSKYDGMDVSMLARPKDLSEENRRPREMYTESQMHSAIPKEALAKHGKTISVT